MGDPHSTAVTIGASCAWMERNWLQSLTNKERINFTAGRYIDNVIIFYTNKLDAERKLKQCYHAPLKLEAVRRLRT